MSSCEQAAFCRAGNQHVAQGIAANGEGLAKAHGCCRKLGRAIGFTVADVEQLMEVCSTGQRPEIFR
jgi:hypothetical protein